MWKSWTNGDNMPIIGQTYPGIGQVLSVRLTAAGETFFGGGVCLLLNKGQGASDTVIADLSGHVFTLTGEAIWTDVGLTLQGSSTDGLRKYLTMPDTDLLRLNGDHSWLFGIKPIVVGNYPSIAMKGPGTTSGGWTIYQSTNITTSRFVNTVRATLANAPFVQDVITQRGMRYNATTRAWLWAIDGVVNNSGTLGSPLPVNNDTSPLQVGYHKAYSYTYEMSHLYIIPADVDVQALTAHPYILPPDPEHPEVIRPMFEVEVVNIPAGSILAPLSGILTPMGM